MEKNKVYEYPEEDKIWEGDTALKSLLGWAALIVTGMMMAVLL